MANNPNVNKVVYGNDTLIDISDTTAVAGDVASGDVFYTADGARATGTLAAVEAATPTLSLVSSAGLSYIEGVTNQSAGKVSYAQKRGTYGLTRIAGQTITPTTTEQTILANGAVVHAYNGAVKVAGSANLKATNIKSGVSLFGVTGSYTGLDTSDATATAEDILSGKTAYVNGSKLTGTYVPSGGLTLLAEDEVTVSTTSTSASTVKDIYVPNDAWVADKLLIVRIIDTLGRRNGRFLGTIAYISNNRAANGTIGTVNNYACTVERVSTAGEVAYADGISAYGVYAQNITKTNNGDVYIHIMRRYSSNYSLTINGTYKVNVYTLDLNPWGL